MPDILRMGRDKAFRTQVARDLANPVVRTFWLHEFPGYGPRLQAEMFIPVQNKLGAVLSDPTLYRTLVSRSIFGDFSCFLHDIFEYDF